MITYDGVYIIFVEPPYNGLVPNSVSIICFLFFEIKIQSPALLKNVFILLLHIIMY